jgi:hypothetical protein
VPVVGCGEVKYEVRYILEFYMYFCLILMDYLIFSGVEVISELPFDAPLTSKVAFYIFIQQI